MPACAINFKAFSSIRRILNNKPRVARGACSCFANHLALRFPEVAERIDEADHGELHLEMGELKLATRDAILCGDWPTVAEQFAYAAQLLKEGDPAVQDAVRISYLGNLFYDEMSQAYAKARCMLPRRLAIALEKTERHYEEMAP